MGLKDYFGRWFKPQTKPDTRELGAVGIQDRWSTYPSVGLTPGGLAYIFREADQGAISRQMELFEEMEEKDAHLASLLQTRKLAVLSLDYEVLPYADTPEDTAHFDALMAWLFQHAGDVKPNLLNADLIPFTYLEAADVWDYAPHYVFTERLGSAEALVLMMGAALAYAKGSGDWVWFERLWRFMLADNLVALDASRIRSVAAGYHLEGLKNLVRVYYADYDQDNSRYCEVRDNTALAAWGETALDVDLRYDAPVVLENPEVAELLATRLLKRLSSAWEVVDVETWLDGARLEIGDTLAVTSPFHGFTQDEFTVFGKVVDLKKRRVSLNLARPFHSTWAWAVDAEGTDYDSSAIDQGSKLDPNWAYRSLAG